MKSKSLKFCDLVCLTHAYSLGVDTKNIPTILFFSLVVQIQTVCFDVVRLEFFTILPLFVPRCSSLYRLAEMS